MTIVNLYAGAGGWDIAATQVGLPAPLGIELDKQAAQTRQAAGYPTCQADLTQYPTPSGHIQGLISSPPCTTYSTAGKLEQDATHINITGHWVETCHPQWVAMEQVTGAQADFKQLAARMGHWGYHTNVFRLKASDYGTPQHRTRCVLLGSLSHRPAIPTPTLTPPPALGELFPHRTTEKLDRRQVSNGSPVRQISLNEIAPTLTAQGAAGTACWRNPDGTTSPLTTQESAAIQGFPPDHPWQGGKTSVGMQIGNAIPPPLAAAVLAQVTA